MLLDLDGGSFDRLRSAFWWLFLASLLSLFVILMPIGAIIGFVGFILLIGGLRRVSKSGIGRARKYSHYSTILIIAFLVWIISAIATLVLIGALIPLIISMLMGYVVIFRSLGHLSTDLQSDELRKAGNYLKFVLILWFLSLGIAVIVILNIYSTLTNVASLDNGSRSGIQSDRGLVCCYTNS